MRILHVTDTYLPRVGGIELHVSDLAARQQAAGHEVRILTREPLGDAPLEDPAVPVTRLRTNITGFGIGVALGPVIASHTPDVVHAHLTVGSPFTWAVLRNTAGVPALASLHSLLPASPALVRAGLAVTGIPTGRITFTAVSRVAADRLHPALPIDRSVGVLHNGIDPGSWTIDHTRTAAFTILSVGRLAARKRPLVLVEALAEFAALNPDLRWTATIVGDGAQRRRVTQAVHALGLDHRVALPGALHRSDIRRLLSRADVFVAPATLESFGIAALEARCAGVPLIGMGSSGITEFVTNERDGLLARTDREIARCLTRLATEPGLGRAIRHHNTRTPTRMAWDTVLAEHDRWYAETIDQEASRRVLAGAHR